MYRYLLCDRLDPRTRSRLPARPGFLLDENKVVTLGGISKVRSIPSTFKGEEDIHMGPFSSAHLWLSLTAKMEARELA